MGVDVGGDILTHCNEPGPPESARRQPHPCSVRATPTFQRPLPLLGPGSTASYQPPSSKSAASSRLTTRPISLTIAHFSTVRDVLEVHPSEATTLLAAALDGVRGRVEIRDAGAKLNLTSQSADAFSLPSWSVAAITRWRGLSRIPSRSTKPARPPRPYAAKASWTTSAARRLAARRNVQRSLIRMSWLAESGHTRSMQSRRRLLWPLSAG